MNAWKYEIIYLFLVLTRISHSFALLTREISWSTLEINSMYYSLFISQCMHTLLISRYFLLRLHVSGVFFLSRMKREAVEVKFSWPNQRVANRRFGVSDSNAFTDSFA